jgi:hypothetical protein
VWAGYFFATPFRGVFAFLMSKRIVHETFAFAGSITPALRVGCFR